MNLFGYGTFITNKLYLDEDNVRAAYLPNYIRIMRPFDQFPFILMYKFKKDDAKIGFWGLKFEIRDSDIDYFDYYEGEGDLYVRIRLRCIYSDCTEEDVFVYYPTQKTIQIYDLYSYISSIDKWGIKIKKECPEVISDFPDLLRMDDPRSNH